MKKSIDNLQGHVDCGVLNDAIDNDMRRRGYN